MTATDNQSNKTNTAVADIPFNAKWNPDLVHQALTAQMANRRQPLAHTKGRGEVRGGGRKPWRQKGTGRSRQGSIRSPLWKGGGVSFGPVKEKIFAKKINKKMRRLAILSVLSKKWRDQEIKIVGELKPPDHKTKAMAAELKKIAADYKSVLLVTGEDGNKNLFLSSRNIPKVKAISVNELNVYDLLTHQYVIFDKTAISKINQKNGQSQSI